MSRNPKFDNEINSLKNKLKTNDADVWQFCEFLKDKKNEGIEFAINTLDTMQKVYEAKDTDYSQNGLPMGNLRSSEEVGVPAWKGTLIRLRDKKNRVASFVERNELLVKDEKVTDTLLDLCNYAILVALLLDEKDYDSKSYIVNRFRRISLLSLLSLSLLNSNGGNLKDYPFYYSLDSEFNTVCKYARETSDN